MILLLDAGNSRLKWAVLRNGHYEYGGVLEHGVAAIKELASAAWSLLDPPEAVLVANVAGEALRRALNSWIKRHWKLTPEYLAAPREELGIHNAYREAARLGIDRWLALLAARELVKGPVCVVDCGTALTIDVLSQDNHHLGGLIIPGIQLMRDSLAARAPVIREQIDRADSDQVSLLGTDTGSAVAGGTVYATVAVIDRVLSDLRADVGRHLRCILTGGDAPLLLPLLGSRVQHEADLVLRGLARIARARFAAQSVTQPDAAAAPAAPQS